MYLYVLLCSGSLNYKLINIFYFVEAHDFKHFNFTYIQSI